MTKATQSIGANNEAMHLSSVCTKCYSSMFFFFFFPLILLICWALGVAAVVRLRFSVSFLFVFTTWQRLSLIPGFKNIHSPGTSHAYLKSFPLHLAPDSHIQSIWRHTSTVTYLWANCWCFSLSSHLVFPNLKIIHLPELKSKKSKPRCYSLLFSTFCFGSFSSICIIHL